MFSKNAIIWVIDQETPAGMMTLSVNIDPNNRIMAGHYQVGDFHSVRWLLEAMGVDSVSPEDTVTRKWSEAEIKACEDAFHASPVEFV